PPIAQPVCVPAASGLVEWWKGDDNARDRTVARDDTFARPISFAPGFVGQAFSFDGDRDSVLVGNPSSLQLQTFTIEAWVKRTSTNQASLDNLQDGTILGYGSGGYSFAVLDDGRLVLSKVGISA